jgi:hypothetical protein
MDRGDEGWILHQALTRRGTRAYIARALFDLYFEKLMALYEFKSVEILRCLDPWTTPRRMKPVPSVMGFVVSIKVMEGPACWSRHL